MGDSVTPQDVAFLVLLFLAIGWLDRKNQKVTLDDEENWAERMDQK